MHWSMRGGGDKGFVKGRQEEMSTDVDTYAEGGYFDYTGPVNFAEDRAWKDAKSQKELLTAAAIIAVIVYIL